MNLNVSFISFNIFNILEPLGAHPSEASKGLSSGAIAGKASRL